MIHPRPSAPLGSVSTLSSYSSSLFTPPCAVLCRITFPLIPFAYSLISRSIPCHILGRDIGAQLCALVERQRALDIDTLSERLRLWCDRETAALLAAKRSPERIQDQYNCLCTFIAMLSPSSRTIPSLLSAITTLFTPIPSLPSVILSTMHRTKGLEWPTVFLLDVSSTLPSTYARTPSALIQEYNLLFVAVTRAILNLHYIRSDCWTD